MTDRILVINPSSTVAVTRAINDAMEPLRVTGVQWSPSVVRHSSQPPRELM